MFSANNTAMRLEKFGLGTKKKNGGEIEKVLKIGFGIQPFTIEMADDLGVKSRLFAPNTGKPHDNVLGETLALGLRMQRISISLAEDQSQPSVVLTEGIVGALTVRKDKEGPVYAASFQVSTTLPEARDLLFLAERYTDQVFVTFEAQEGSLLDSAGGDEGGDGED
jgi:hypothetical protein